MKALVWGLGALAVAATGLPADADAQDRRTERRLEAIERQLSDMQGVVYGSDGRPAAGVRFEGANPNGQQAAAGGAASADLSLRIGQIEQEVQRLTGRIEELQFQLNQQNQQMQRLIAQAYPEFEGDTGLGLNAQKDALTGGASGRPGAPDSGITGGGPIDLVGGGSGDGLPSFSDAESAYAAGRSALLEARYAQAERAFLVVTEDFPSSARAGDATYYLGETYLAQGDLGGAARSYLDFIRSYPESERAAEAHLKLGQAFARADKTTEACKVWLRALRTYDDMDDLLRKRITDMRAASCS